MASVVHVIPIINVVDVNVIGFVPGARPVFRPWINDTEPETPVPESRVSTHYKHWGAVNAKPVLTAKVGTKAVVGNAVASVASTFMPSSMFLLPMLGAMVLPNILRSVVVLISVCFAHVLGSVGLSLLRPLFLVFVHVLRRPPVLLLALISLLLMGRSLGSWLSITVNSCS